MSSLKVIPKSKYKSNQQAIDSLLNFRELERRRMMCSAVAIQTILDWKSHELEVKFNDQNKTFFVRFNGKLERQTDLDEVIKQEIPIKIAQTSYCECGNTLSLEDYSVKQKDFDYTLVAKYSCKVCKKNLTAKKEGLAKLIENYSMGLDSLEFDFQAKKSDNNNWILGGYLDKKLDEYLILISEGKLEEVIPLLQSFCISLQDSEIITLWAVTTARYNDLKSEIARGTVYFDHQLVIKSKIIESTIQLISSLKKGFKGNEDAIGRWNREDV